ncbi:hypothetical protein DGG96_13110 [Legionella qingyii]|uniref:Uncharacterized protein n=1 Tax=Legionella qingyii TaxID=2184757 RepID=A0A317U2Y2_9GAMM|nr:hypothetical protein [Legionella qingyii]PWY55116.1 hypothetical protein DGG96_13110 [Legionella qingyii]RUR25461.1 hypothetical protein ELY20_03105 [Legionella qingyii]RUR28429.1 hypothetical protein ELY16_02905 [Legionella qingyii]
MPVSKECIILLQNLVDGYRLEGKEDRDYSLIYSLLKEFSFLVVQHQKNHKDERIIGFLSASAMILEENLCFAKVCRTFLISYQQKTHALDSMLDIQLNIQSELDASWGKKHETELSHSPGPSPFFLELQEAIAKRAQRLADNELFEKPNP